MRIIVESVISSIFQHAKLLDHLLGRLATSGKGLIIRKHNWVFLHMGCNNLNSYMLF